MKGVFLLLVLSVVAHGRLIRLEADQDTAGWADQGWKKLHRVEPHKHVHLTFALKQRNLGQLEALAKQVSDPRSPLYGKYMTIDEITEFVAPLYDTLDTIQVWLASHKIFNCDLTLNRDFLLCLMPCRLAEKLLLGTVFHYYSHDKLSKKVVRSTSSYYVPENVSHHLDFIGGVHRFPAVNWGKTNDEELRQKEIKEMMAAAGKFGDNGFHIGVYPKVLRDRYNLTVEDVGSHPNNSQVVAQFLEQYYHPADLSEFMSIFVGSEFVHQTEIPKVIGPNSGRAGIEASLDTQYIMGTGANITTWFWSTGGRHESQEPFLTWLINVGNTSQVPFVHSVSYGEVETSLSVAYMQRVNVEFMKTTLRGITILFASGDDGAACKAGKVFDPAFPASSPWVTTVGGTGFNNPFGVGKEFAYEISGGGFSNIFPTPEYQKEQVDTYFQIGSKIPPVQYYNKTGRAYPDIAALCRHFWVVNNRVPAPGVMGTSASTPSVAGIISMLNEHRLHSNKPVMGFLNPFLYQNPDALYDVTSGCNEGCLPHDKGFCAGAKWDPVSGNGSPNYPALVKAAMKVFE